MEQNSLLKVFSTFSLLLNWNWFKHTEQDTGYKKIKNKKKTFGYLIETVNKFLKIYPFAE